MGQEVKDFQRPNQTAVIEGMRREDDGFYVPEGIKWGTYYKRHAEALQFVMPFVKVKRLAVQAGGHVGAYPIWLASHFRLVYTFEPNPVLYPALVLNTRRADYRIIASPLSLGYQQKTKWSNGQVITLDSLQLPVCDLLCLDIEGGEHLALCGALQTIERHRPVILMEEAPIEHNQPTWYAAYQRACDLLRSQDYIMHETVRCGPDRIWTPKQ